MRADRRKDGANADENALLQVRRGLILFLVKEATIGYKLINARTDGIAGKPSFLSAFKAHRCKMSADGFYE